MKPVFARSPGHLEIPVKEQSVDPRSSHLHRCFADNVCHHGACQERFSSSHTHRKFSDITLRASAFCVEEVFADCCEDTRQNTETTGTLSNSQNRRLATDHNVKIAAHRNF